MPVEQIFFYNSQVKLTLEQQKKKLEILKFFEPKMIDDTLLVMACSKKEAALKNMPAVYHQFVSQQISDINARLHTLSTDKKKLFYDTYKKDTHKPEKAILNSYLDLTTIPVKFLLSLTMRWQ